MLTEKLKAAAGLAYIAVWFVVLPIGLAAIAALVAYQLHLPPALWQTLAVIAVSVAMLRRYWR